jgi:hypothetical protein
MAIKASAPPLRLLQRSLPRLCTPLAGFSVKSSTHNPCLLFVVAVFPVFGNSRLQLEEEERRRKRRRRRRRPKRKKQKQNKNNIKKKELRPSLCKQQIINLL